VWRRGARFGAAKEALAETLGDIVHAQHEVFLFGGPLASVQFPRVLAGARRADRPAVVTVHGVVDLRRVDSDFARANGFRVPPAVARGALRALIGGAARSCDAVIVHDGIFRDRLVRQYRVAESRINVIPLPVPQRESITREEARDRLALTSPMALFFGFVTGYKGLPLLLAAWEAYRRRGGEGELVVAGGRHPRLAGDPRYERDYEELMGRAARAGNVRWVGYLSDEEAPVYLAASDALVLPYRDALSASGPLSFGLAYGVPLLVSEVLGPLAPSPVCVFPRTPEALAELLAEVLDGGKGPELVAASRASADAASLERVAERTVDLYRSLL
jgi:glycosyltransferase involved in cell wall biosynthesis